ncbi:thymidine kinase [Akhmeta virus]|uniref:Thymidine kinase n=2 Tax=Orthopoxvirus TaxID=10242 RepID=A0A346FS64_9POXV|nr:thymidine kinase [Akhmeta virus]AXN74887.1 thymidine kinase [Akhmeta virus]AXN75107.1 thymidine kinase [Akhmeta virus]AXN75326.1 thymidine kinase [Akhmeta virus]QEQ49436.1 Thymidine kinase [Akhmeta virus]
MNGGHIQLIIGPMFSGKSTELIRRVRRYQIAQYKCVIIKYSNDNRYGTGLWTHDKNNFEALEATKLCDVLNAITDFSVIGIDEGQFFPDIVEFCERTANEGKIVIVAALDGTFQRKPFNNILDLIPLSEMVVKLTAVCMKCFKEASFSKRLGVETEIEIIGGNDMYQSVCRKCYIDS